MSKDVVMLFDIDGPLNPFLSFTAGDDPRFVVVNAGWNTGVVNVVDHKQWFHEFYRRGTTMVWVTNWGKEAAVVTELFEVPAMPWVVFGEARSSEGTWKLPYVKEFIDSQYPDSAVIWLDDELHDDALQWGKTRGDVLLVKVNPSVGWTEFEKDFMLSFVDRYK